MNNAVHKMMLFTLSACPVGRSMGTVLQETVERHPEIAWDAVAVDIMTDVTNQYRIKQNPTTLFLDREGRELYRLEGFQETEQVLDAIRKINEGNLRSEAEYEPNRESTEMYTIYLIKEGELVPVETRYINATSVRAPRITAIQLLLRTRPDGFVNPFPPSARLERVDFFEGKRGEIRIAADREALDAGAESVMREALALTLSHFGIEETKLIFV